MKRILLFGIVPLISLCVVIFGCNNTKNESTTIETTNMNNTTMDMSTHYFEKQDSEESVMYQLHLGYELISYGEYDDALQAFDNVIGMDPMCSGAYVGKADSYFASRSPNMIWSIHNALNTGYRLTHDESLICAYIGFASELSEMDEISKAIELLRLGYESTGNEELLNRFGIICIDAPNIWQYYLEYSLESVTFSGDSEWKTVGYSEFESYALYDIDNDNTDELIIRYQYPSFDYENIEILDYAYIILKNYDGYILRIADFWNMGGLESTVLRCDGIRVYVYTWRYAVFANRINISYFSEGKLVEFFSYTEHGDAENGGYFPIYEENGYKYITVWSDIEKYLGNNLSTSTESINSYEELIALIEEIRSYDYVHFLTE